MRFESRPPRPPLDALVAYLWALHDAPAHAREHVVASGTQELVVNLREDVFEIDAPGAPRRRLSGAMVSGAYRRYFVIDTRAHGAIVGVHFRAGAAAPVLGVPPGALVDRHVDLDALWGATARSLRERLCAARTTAERFDLLERALLARVRRLARHAAVGAAVERLADPEASIARVASELGMSTRRLGEVFTAEVGMSPKRFARVRRFERALAIARRAAAPEWAAIAIECGYFDQAHLVRDFVDLGGTSPARLVRRGADTKAHHVVGSGATGPATADSSNPRPRSGATLRSRRPT